MKRNGNIKSMAINLSNDFNCILLSVKYNPIITMGEWVRGDYAQHTDK